MDHSVQDAGGRPLEGAAIRLRDRMSDSWRTLAEDPSTAAYALDPIPYPPTVRLVRGEARIPSFRLEFSVELDDGWVFLFRETVDPKVRLTARLPRQTGA